MTQFNEPSYPATENKRDWNDPLNLGVLKPGTSPTILKVHGFFIGLFFGVIRGGRSNYPFQRGKASAPGHRRGNRAGGLAARLHSTVRIAAEANRPMHPRRARGTLPSSGHLSDALLP